MTSPFERDPDVEAALRASLDAHARQAPAGDDLAARIIAEAQVTPRSAPPRRSWGRFTLPAAAAILAAIAGIALAVVDSGPGSKSPPVAETTAPLPSPSAVSTAQRSTSSTASAEATTSSPVDTSSLHDVRIIDLTFTGTDDGWALASARCVNNPAARCTAIMRSTDGVNWSSHPGDSPFSVADVDNCADPCVSHIRFADDRTGYVYGPDALFMTTDGGATWKRQQGLGADALETLNRTVLLVRVSNTACPTRCLLTLRSTIGSTEWTPFRLPTPVPNDGGATLSRAGHVAVLDVSSVNLAKGLSGVGAFYRSTDDGRSWQSVGVRCPSIGTGSRSDPTLAAIAADGSTVVVACAARGLNGTVAGSTLSSTDQGRRFAVPAAGGKLGPAQLLAVADAQTQLVTAPGPSNGELGLYRSTDAGDTWTLVSDVAGSLRFLGFENDRVGRAVADNGTTIWTTRDGGSTWTKKALP